MYVLFTFSCSSYAEPEGRESDFLSKTGGYAFKGLLAVYLMNGFSHCYQLRESTFLFRGIRSDFYFLSHFSMKFLCNDRIAPDRTPCSAASHLGLCCLPISHKKDARLI